MHDLHVDDFYKDSALTLMQLYMNFPRRKAVYVEDVSGPDQVDEYGLHSERHIACLGAMLWLAEEGFLRFEDTIRQEAIDQAVLSHKTFVLLSGQHEFPISIEEEGEQRLDEEGMPASILYERRTNIYCLREALRSKSSNRVRNIMQYLLARFP